MGVSTVKCKQPHPGFELRSPCPFPTMVTITPQVLYSFLYICVHEHIYLNKKSLDTVNGAW